jgi:hypothetical protein
MINSEAAVDTRIVRLIDLGCAKTCPQRAVHLMSIICNDDQEMHGWFQYPIGHCGRGYLCPERRLRDTGIWCDKCPNNGRLQDRPVVRVGRSISPTTLSVIPVPMPEDQVRPSLESILGRMGIVQKVQLLPIWAGPGQSRVEPIGQWTSCCATVLPEYPDLRVFYAATTKLPLSAWVNSFPASELGRVDHVQPWLANMNC